MDKRYCLECTHFYYFEGEVAYSEITPGCDASMYCGMDHWRVDFYWDNRHTLAEYFAKANTCEDFDEDEELAKIGRKNDT